MGPDEAKRLKELEVENARLKKLLAEAELDKAILKGGRGGKMVSPAKRRAATAHVVTKLGVSQRRACRALGTSRSSVRRGASGAHGRRGAARPAARAGT